MPASGGIISQRALNTPAGELTLTVSPEDHKLFPTRMYSKLTRWQQLGTDSDLKVCTRVHWRVVSCAGCSGFWGRVRWFPHDCAIISLQKNGVVAQDYLACM